MILQREPLRKKVFLAGSSHTRMLFIFIKDLLAPEAIVSKLPYDAGNTEEILGTIGSWPLADKNVVHVYTGHRDLMPGGTGRPIVSLEVFWKNLEKIIGILNAGTRGKIIFSNVPPVAESFLELDPDRNDLISEYNKVIETVTARAGIEIHDFWGFVERYSKSEDVYMDGLHFTRKFYRIYATDLAGFLKKLL